MLVLSMLPFGEQHPAGRHAQIPSEVETGGLESLPRAGRRDDAGSIDKSVPVAFVIAVRLTAEADEEQALAVRAPDRRSPDVADSFSDFDLFSSPSSGRHDPDPGARIAAVMLAALYEICDPSGENCGHSPSPSRFGSPPNVGHDIDGRQAPRRNGARSCCRRERTPDRDRRRDRA